MKRSICILLAIVLTFGLCACHGMNETEAIQTNETIQTTEPDTQQAQWQSGDNCVPVLVGYYRDDLQAKAEGERIFETAYTTWDLENGGFTDATPWLRQEVSSFMDTGIEYWNGGGYIDIWHKAEPLLDGLTVHQIKSIPIYYGTTVYYASGNLYRIEEDGSNCLIPLARIPEEMGVDLEQCFEPYFAWADEENAFVAYMVYDFAAQEADIIYGSYALDRPEDIQWKTFHLGVEYAYFSWMYPYNLYVDGKFYISTREALLELDVRTDELAVLDQTNLFRPIYELYPDGDENADIDQLNYGAVGYWEDTMLLALNRYTADGSYHCFYIAVKDGRIIAAMERTDWGVFTFYDENMQLLCVEDRYKDNLQPQGMQLPWRQ